jgi:hypothetical protein
MSDCILTESNVQEAFLAAPPLVAETIYNLTVKQPRWVRDLPNYLEFPRGNGTQMYQLIARGQMPQIERGFDQWKKLGNNTGCNPCEGPDCAYNITPFGGMGLERKVMELMSRDFQSPSYCIKEIQTTAHFKQVFSQIVQNLYAQIDFFKEQNIAFNYLTSLAKKYVIDSSGARPNPGNPYQYPPKGTATLSALNIEILSFFYEYMMRIPDAVPYDVVNGAPVFAMECSSELLSRLYRDDPQLRQDVRFSGLSDALVTKYNFMGSIRGMFIPAPILYPRRFRWDSVAGQWLEVLPFENGIPMEVGSFTGFNPNYQDPSYATHEEVLLHGKYPFSVYYMPTETTLGENTSFGPEFSFMNSWQWVNPLTNSDPARRVGYFFTSATIGLAPQFSEAIFGILVERAQVGLMFAQNPQPSCPVEPTDCDNVIPDPTVCPCPVITSSYVNPVNGNSILTLAVPLSPVPEAADTIQFGIDTGGYIVGTVVDSSEDGTSVEVTFPDGTDLGVCDHFTTIFCDNTMGCSARVLSQCASGDNALKVILSNAIKADANNDVVTVTYSDGTQEDVDVSGTPNLSTLEWTLDGFAATFVPGSCSVPTIVSICVPTATDSSCPGCGGATYTQCET